jgi:hypothetical protein
VPPISHARMIAQQLGSAYSIRNNHQASDVDAPTSTNPSTMTSSCHAMSETKNADDDAEYYVTVEGCRVKIVPPTAVEQAMQNNNNGAGAVIRVRCIGCDCCLYVCHSMSMIFCPACKTVAPADLMRQITSSVVQPVPGRRGPRPYHY